MKGNISRESHRPGNRYSAVFQVQGGMVTDADLGEQAAIARMRTDALGHDAVCCGVPGKDGAVIIGAGDLPALTEGTVYAEGVRGQTVASDTFSGALGYLEVQVDFPLAPAVGADNQQIVYVDIWERMISLLEDPNLADAGLHGVETAFRTRTMTQIKLAPLSEADAIMNGSGRFPRIGSGQLGVTPVDPETISDDCDPCADVVSAEQTVANALFRIEVLHVVGPANAPTMVTIAWSAENGSAIAPATVNSEDFERAGAVYEFFSPVTASHLGVHSDTGDAQVSVFAENLTDGPSDQTAPEGGDWPFVRRWDGIVEVDIATDTVTRVGGGTLPTWAGGAFTLTVDAFTAAIDFSGGTVVAGDYWLIELRRFSDTPIRAVQASPVGIVHNYCTLFRLTNGSPEPLTDAELRKLCFPHLADLPATHIDFDNNCPKLYDDAENIQEALDNLCNINAADIPFDPSDCPRLYDTTDNVQDALNNLCRIDFGNERLLHLLHDWGVICGVLLRLVKADDSVIRISEGAILNRVGRIGTVPAFEIDLNSLVGTEFFRFDSLDRFAEEFVEQGVCLALAIDEGGAIDTYVLPKDQAFEPRDPTFTSTLLECLREKPVFEPAEDLTTRPAAEKQTLDKVFYGAAKQKLAGAQRLDGEEFQVAQRFNDELIVEYRTHVKDEALLQVFEQRLVDIDREFDLDQASGPALETRRLQREALRYRAIQEDNLRRWQECICSALLPRCPTPGKPPHLVPVGCVTGRVANGAIQISTVCPYDCRKHAMSWRMVQYYIAELRQVFAERLAAICCRAPDPPTPGGGLTHIDFPLAQAVPPAAAVNPEFFIGRIDKSFDILTGHQPANEYRVRPDIGNLGLSQAKDLLVGNGIEVAETLDLADTEAIAKLRKGSVGIQPNELLFDEGALQPGDKVAILLQDGVAVDYIKLENGPGKLLFDTKTAAAPETRPGTTDTGGIGPSRPGDEVLLPPGNRTELDAAENAARVLEERIARIREETQQAENDLLATERQRRVLADEVAATSTELTTLETRRIDLQRQVTSANATLETARNERLELARELDVSSARLKDLADEHRSLETEITSARTELRTVAQEQERTLATNRDEHDKLVLSMRRNAPVTVVVRDNEALTTALASRGITTQGGLAELSDTDLRAIATESRTNIRTVTALRDTAGKQINAAIV